MNKYYIMACSLFVILLVGCTQNDAQTMPPSAQGNNNQAVVDSGEKGRAVFVITDAAADMKTVTSVRITVEEISVHSQAQGWVSVSSTPKTYDLLQLKAQNSNALLADAQLDEGTYDEMRLDVSSVIVTDASGSQEAKLPSNELKLKGDLIVTADSTASASFDFIADESLHVTGNGKYVMAPVLKVETREDVDVSVDSQNDVKINGGSLKTSVTQGMDASGKVGVGLKIPKDVAVSLDAAGIIKIGGSGKEGSEHANASTKTKISIGSGNASAESETEIDVGI